MKVSFENPDKINGLMTLVVEEADYKNEVEKTLKDYRKKANVPGFRPGQAPMGMIKRQFGASVKMEAINKLVGQEIYKYVQDNNIQMLDQSADIINVDPISVLAFGNRFLITDGHHRAYQALLAGRDMISAEFDRDGGDALYALYAQACEERKIDSVLDLKNRILPQDEYEAKWYNWCEGFNQAATLLLERQADETDKANR